jgi:hypothetical protein
VVNEHSFILHDLPRVGKRGGENASESTEDGLCSGCRGAANGRVSLRFEGVKKFAELLGDMKVGDVIELDMVPGGGTAVLLNGEEMGVIDGNDFATALLKV